VSDVFVRRPVTSVRVRSIDVGQVVDRPDKLATEEPMEIRVHGPGQEHMPLAVTMRTPGADFELAVGFCVTEGVVPSGAEVANVAYCVDGGEQQYNIVTVFARVPVSIEGRERNFFANASCGLCGKAALDQVELELPPIDDGVVVDGSTVLELPGRLRDVQRVFDVTGGLHAAALFDATGGLVAVREDVGRHNALDKLVGHAALGGRLPLRGHVLLVSGRVSFEIVQKAAAAGIPVLCAVSAPSSLAVQAATRLGQTVVGFVRPGRFNVYSHPERVDVTR
jgi:FdhD protein